MLFEVVKIHVWNFWKLFIYQNIGGGVGTMPGKGTRGFQRNTESLQSGEGGETRDLWV